MSKIIRIFISSLLSLLISFPLFAKPLPQIKKAIDASVLVYVPGVGSGSGFGVYQLQDSTIIATNDHVCQMTRGLVFLTDETDFTKRLNSNQIYVENAAGKKYKAKVVMTTNLEKLKKEQRDSDLCLLKVEEILPVLEISPTDSEIGDRVFSVSAPHGIFPMVHEAYIGPTILEAEGNMLETQFSGLYIHPGSSGGAVLDFESGKVVGVIFAIIPVDSKIHSPIAALNIPASQLNSFIARYLEKRKDTLEKQK
jgi:S1-C subfamily serine protease